MFQVWPRPNLYAVAPGPRKAVLLLAEACESTASNSNLLGGAVMVWDGWDLRGRPLPTYKCRSTIQVQNDVTCAVSLRYTMTQRRQGESCGHIRLEVDVHDLPSDLLETLCVGLRITVPWARHDRAFAFTVAPGVRIKERTGRRTFIRAWKIKPFNGLAILSAILTHGHSQSEYWSVYHEL